MHQCYGHDSGAGVDVSRYRYMRYMYTSGVFWHVDVMSNAACDLYQDMVPNKPSTAESGGFVIPMKKEEEGPWKSQKSGGTRARCAR